MRAKPQQIQQETLGSRDMETLGLRDRQRLRRHRAILFSAAELFSSKGFSETTMEDIANVAEVSPPTIYKYFRSKSDILLGLLEVDKELMVEGLDAIIAAPNGDALEVLCAFVRADLEGGYDIRQKSLWRMISAAALEASDERFAAYGEVQSVFSRKLQVLIERLQQDGKIDACVDPVTAARAINAITRECFRMYVHTEKLTIEEMVATSHAQLSLFWKGLRPDAS